MRHLKLNLVTLVCGLLFCSSVFAVKLGDPSLRSYLGQPLNVQVPISGMSNEDLNSTCIHGTVNTIDGDYIVSPRTEFIFPKHNAHNELSHGPTLVTFVTNQNIAEPAISLSVTVKCGASLQRNFALLLDYPEITTPPAANVSNNISVTPITPVEPVKRKRSAPDVTRPAKPKKQPAAKRTRSPSPKPSEDTAEAQNSITAVKPRESITQKLAAQPTVPKDELKISSEAVTQSMSASTPAASTTEKSPVDIEQQRLQENKLAEERVAAMLRDEPARLTDQAAKEQTAERTEHQQKVQQLEKEVQQLRLQIHNASKPPEHHYPTILMVMNVVVLLILLVLLLVVGKLWLSLRKSSQPQNNHWWSPPTDLQQKREDLVAAAKKTVAAASQLVEPQKANTVKKAEPTQAAHEATPKEPHLNTPPGANAAESLQPEDGNGQPFNMFTSNRGQSIQIEELSDSTQEAEFWVSLDNPKRAIEILESQSHDENLTMPVTLLYLLDLYRQVGDEDKYTQLTARLKRKFNIHIPQFGEAIDPSEVKHLEDYEHITSRCCAFWNTNYIVPYLESLLIDDREGNRIGFDLSVYRDILFLITICKELDRAKSTSATTPQ